MKPNLNENLPASLPHSLEESPVPKRVDQPPVESWVIGGAFLQPSDHAIRCLFALPLRSVISAREKRTEG